jgi:hypothetical protein
MYVSQTFQDTSKYLYLLLFFIKTGVNKFSKVDTTAKLHRDVQYFERKNLHVIHNRRMTWGVILFLGGLIDTRSIRMFHILPSIFKSNITIFIIFEYNPTILHNWSIITILTSWFKCYESWTTLLPIVVDLIYLLYFWCFIFWIFHIWDYFLDWISILEPGLIVSYNVWMIQFR